jgi:hypothetical protein
MKIVTACDGVGSIDALGTMYPSSITGRRIGREMCRFGGSTSTVYAYVLEGAASFHVGSHASVSLDAGGYFSSPDAVEIVGEAAGGIVVVVERAGFRGQLVAGRVERQGRLSYIDGCSDSILVYPPRMGDPVFNHLHFPKGIDQTQHLHPSIRLGAVVRGAGVAKGPGWEKELRVGDMFLLDEQEIHSFATPVAAMDVVAFHPDSDWGPLDGNHPMVNRTLIQHGKPGSAR